MLFFQCPPARLQIQQLWSFVVYPEENSGKIGAWKALDFRGFQDAGWEQSQTRTEVGWKRRLTVTAMKNRGWLYSWTLTDCFFCWFCTMLHRYVGGRLERFGQRCAQSYLTSHDKTSYNIHHYTSHDKTSSVAILIKTSERVRRGESSCT